MLSFSIMFIVRMVYKRSFHNCWALFMESEMFLSVVTFQIFSLYFLAANTTL